MAHEQDQAAGLDVTLPARVSVRCPSCGHVRGTLVLHDDALRRVKRCEQCGSEVELVESRPFHGLGCPCCS